MNQVHLNYQSEGDSSESCILSTNLWTNPQNAWRIGLGSCRSRIHHPTLKNNPKKIRARVANLKPASKRRLYFVYYQALAGWVRKYRRRFEDYTKYRLHLLYRLKFEKILQAFCELRIRCFTTSICKSILSPSTAKYCFSDMTHFNFKNYAPIFCGLENMVVTR